jgi:hypothetical protein
MTTGVLVSPLSFRVVLGVGGTTVASGSRPHPSHSCDGWVCDLGAVGVSLIFGLIRGPGSFDTVLPTFVLVSRIHLAQQYRDNDHFLRTESSSRHVVDFSLVDLIFISRYF